MSSVNSFEERQKAFENKYKHDQDMLFRILSRRARLTGLWAAEHLGLKGAEANSYALQVVDVDLDEPGHMDMVRKIKGDFELKNIEISEHRIEREMERLLNVAREQVTTE
ncbi:Aldolase [Azospirillaceae bacterium]